MGLCVRLTEFLDIAGYIFLILEKVTSGFDRSRSHSLTDEMADVTLHQSGIKVDRNPNVVINRHGDITEGERLVMVIQRLFIDSRPPNCSQVSTNFT